MANTFKAFRIHTIDGKPVCRFEKLSIQDIDGGDVVIEVAYSAVSHNDAMVARGAGKNIRAGRPCIGGTDLSGMVVTSADPRFNAGDKVIVTHYKLGTEHDGAYADYACVPGNWVVPLPDELTLYEAMGLGTCGLTAGLALDRLERAGLSPTDGPVAITCPTDGVGSLAVDIFSRRGYEVIAISEIEEQEGFLRSIGATSFMSCAELLETRAELSTTVLPRILRSIDILSINVTRQLQMDERRHLWRRLATDIKPVHLDKTSRPIPFEALDDAIDNFFEATSVGRVIVEVGSKAPL